MIITIDTDEKTIEIDGNLDGIQIVDISAHLEHENTSLDYRILTTNETFYGIPKTKLKIANKFSRIDGKTTIVYEME